jgi:hypothetical protein
MMMTEQSMTKMTKTSAKWVASLAILGGSMGSVANASPVTWTDYHDYTPDLLLNTFQTELFTHDITDGVGGFKAGLDQIDSYSLTFDLYDDKDQAFEWALFAQPGGATTFTSLAGTETASWTFSGIWELENTGHLTVAFSSLLGDFYLGSSTLTVKGHSVPEPGTLALFGAALLGFGLIRRKRITG